MTTEQMLTIFCSTNQGWSCMIHAGDTLVARKGFCNDRHQVIDFLTDHGMALDTAIFAVDASHNAIGERIVGRFTAFAG